MGTERDDRTDALLEEVIGVQRGVRTGRHDVRLCQQVVQRGERGGAELDGVVEGDARFEAERGRGIEDAQFHGSGRRGGGEHRMERGDGQLGPVQLPPHPVQVLDEHLVTCISGWGLQDGADLLERQVEVAEPADRLRRRDLRR